MFFSDTVHTMYCTYKTLNHMLYPYFLHEINNKKTKKQLLLTILEKTQPFFCKYKYYVR